MSRRHTLLGGAAILALALAVPALGGPSNPVAHVAAGLKKKVNRALSTAESAQTTANSAQGAANSAQAAATAAQASADAANAAAATALSTAQSKQDRVRWAFVRSDGVFAAQSGGISPTAASGGVYILDFGSSQQQKAIMATPWAGGSVGEVRTALCGGGAPPGVTCSAGDDINHIQVVTTNSAGTGAALGFFIAVIP